MKEDRRGEADRIDAVQHAAVARDQGARVLGADAPLDGRLDEVSHLEAYLTNAVRMLENGTASKDDIDTAMKLGCGYPMGPFTLLDFVGLDTTYYIANIMFEEFREPAYAPPPLLKRMVLAGRLGRKSGHGFYAYA